MKYFFIILLSYFFLISSTSSEEIKIIELHEKKDQVETQNDEVLFNNKEESLNNEEEIIVQEDNENIIEEVDASEEIVNVEKSIVVSVAEDWELSSKENLDFLFKNINMSKSKVINSYFIKSLTDFSKIPKLYTQAEFDNLRIATLSKIGKKEEAVKLLNNINTYDNFSDYYDRIKLDSFLTKNELSEACSFKDSIQQNQSNYILKVSIFCAFLENKKEEADFLNSLLLDSDDNDQYFQKIYFNLKNNINKEIDISKGSFIDTSFPLYSAMIRIGGLAFTEQFLDFDLTNLTLPIILSPTTDISLRIKSAHKAYKLKLLKAESLSALYQSVDFSSDELNNWSETIKKIPAKSEIGMALLFQNASVQLLPITRLESLKEFWNYAINNDLEEIAYDVSRNLIDSIEPSVELFDYSILISRAHIFNENFELAKKWILFFENYSSQTDSLDQNELDNINFLFNLQRLDDNAEFLTNLQNNLISKIKNEDNFDNYNEILKTIFFIVLNEESLIDKIKNEQVLLDSRPMPSNYIINSIIESAENNKKGELIMSIMLSLSDNSWNDIHPMHLKIILESLKKANLNNLFKDLVIEIFEENKII